MDPKEIYDYAMGGIALLASGGVSYFSAMALCQISTSWPFRKKISSQEELSKIIEEEAPKLGLDSKKIFGKYDALAEGCFAQKTARGHSVVLKADSWMCTRNAVKHELYHIYRGHCDDKGEPGLLDVLDYNFRREPQAVLYETFGIKI